MNTLNRLAQASLLLALLFALGSCSPSESDMAYPEGLIGSLVRRDTQAAIEHLQNGADPNERYEDQSNDPGGVPDPRVGVTALMLTVGSFSSGPESIELVKLLIEKGARVNDTDPHGANALHYAVPFAGVDENMSIIRALVDAGIDLEARSEAMGSPGQTPVQIASYLGQAEVARLLIDAGAETRPQPSEDGLSLVALAGSVEVLEVLLEAGVNVNEKNEDNGTALTFLSDQEPDEDQIVLANALIKHGIDVNAVDDSGKTALAYAMAHKNQALVDLLKSAGAK